MGMDAIVSIDTTTTPNENLPHQQRCAGHRYRRVHSHQDSEAAQSPHQQTADLGELGWGIKGRACIDELEDLAVPRGEAIMFDQWCVLTCTR